MGHMIMQIAPIPAEMKCPSFLLSKFLVRSASILPFFFFKPDKYVIIGLEPIDPSQV